MKRPLKPTSEKPPQGGGGVTPRMTYPKWMNDAFASDLNAVLEQREAAARAEQIARIQTVADYLDRTGFWLLPEGEV